MSDNLTNSKNTNNNNNTGRLFICGVVEGFYGRPWSFDQRKDLFKRLKQLGMNSFMYAPKDDDKHRSKWRQLYSDYEANQLKALIDDAKTNGVDFYYSLAPGLDMKYSDENELACLIKKYDQLVGLGCESFAILFDDIEPTISNEDEEVFKNYASAQVSVANMIFEHLGRPKFMFCPTEYCESRAVPNVLQSLYLNTLGTGLSLEIDIMWSGPRVISRLITEESLDELTRTIRRPPVIWENLHANDYDKKRVFLGPYSGRSTRIIPKLRGILTNPNCEYEANYIAIHTLAQWTKCTEDSSLHNQTCSESDQAGLCVTGMPISGDNPSTYDPARALAVALNDWIPRLLEMRALPDGVDLTTVNRRDEAAACEQLEKVTNDIDIDDTNVDMLLPDNTQSSTMSTNKSEMDLSGSPTDINDCDSCDMPDVGDSTNYTLTASESATNQDPALIINDRALIDCVMSGNAPEIEIKCNPEKIHQTVRESNFSNDQENLARNNPLTLNELSMFVDMFYLPFAHGTVGYTLLTDVKWLKENSEFLIEENRKQQDSQQEVSRKDEMKIDSDTTKDSSQTVETGQQQRSENDMNFWLIKAEKLSQLCHCINRLVNTMMNECPNKLVVLELYPYLSDAKELSTLIIEYIKFLRYRSSNLDRFYFPGMTKQTKFDIITSDEQEPWAHQGGLIADVKRLLSSTS